MQREFVALIGQTGVEGLDVGKDRGFAAGGILEFQDPFHRLIVLKNDGFTTNLKPRLRVGVRQNVLVLRWVQSPLGGRKLPTGKELT